MSWKIIWKSLASSDMRTRIFAVLGMLLVYRILAHVPIPLGDPQTLKQVLENLFTADTPQLLNFLDVLSGGALANFSIMLIGLGPYINASIIMQLLTRAIPKLETLNKEGEFGRKKINQYTRLLTLPLAIIQAIGAIYLVRETAIRIGGIGDITAEATLGQWVLMVGALTGGAMMLMWLGEMITERGIGNGISLLITAGIVSTLPATISGIAGAVVSGESTLRVFNWNLPINQSQLIFAGILALATLAMIVFVVKINEARRAITIHYAKRVQGNRAYGGVTTTLPVKMIAAGVIPIIFAVAFLSIPSFAGQLMLSAQSERLQLIGQNLLRWFENPSPQTFAQGGFEPYIYPVVYFVLVFMFTFFYTGITFNSKDIAENLQKQGGFIEGVRSGAQTEKYLSKVVNRLTLFGALSLGFIAVVPVVGQAFMTTNIALGGTSILILVAVALETLRSIESRALMVTYDQYDQPDYFRETGLPEEPTSKKARLLSLIKRKAGRSKDDDAY
jgi:preprotein translocase subunit SecY